MKIIGRIICAFAGHRKGKRVVELTIGDTLDHKADISAGKTCYECPRCHRRLWRKARSKAQQ